MKKRTEVARAKVARLLTDYVVAITAGEGSGIGRGDEVTVYREFDVPDPSTRESLGTARMTVVRLRVFDVDEKFSLGRTFESVPSQRGIFIPSTLGMGERDRVRV